MGILSDPTPDMLAMPRFDDGAIDMQELLRRLAEQVVNAVMDAEADQLCGGGANSRNGYRERSLATCVGTLTLRIPKLRSGSFFPEDVLERYQRVDRALVAAVAEMYATGTSTRKVQRVAEKMGVSVNLFFTSFAKQAHRSRKGGFTGCANVFSPIPVTA